MAASAKNDISAFLVGSSIASTVFTYIYMGVAIYAKGRPSSVPYELIPFLVGLVLSLMGRFGANLPKTLFGFENEWLVHLIAIVLYALIFRFWVTYLIK